MMELKWKRLSENATLPTKATPHSAGFDLYACLEKAEMIAPGEIKRIPIGIAVAPEKNDVVLLVFPRSGLASKNGITLANSVGVIDSDYRGEIQVPLINLSQTAFCVEPNMRIAQPVVMPVIPAALREVDTLDETERGSGGFGSSGVF